MSTEIKVYLCEPKTNDNLCFHASVNNQKDYDIFVDLNHVYEPLMIEAFDNTLEIDYIEENDTYTRGKSTINGRNLEEQIYNFLKYLDDFYGLITESNDLILNQIIGIRLVGSGFRGNQDIPMLERSQYKAMHSMHSIRKGLFPKPVNTLDYVGDDIYIKKGHGSLKLSLEATNEYSSQVEFMQMIFDDIENETIDPYKFDSESKTESYQLIIKNLDDLCRTKKLEDLYISINGEEKPITKKEYLKYSASSIYEKETDYIGAYDSYNRVNNTFEITVDGIGKRYCHLEKIIDEDYSEYERILNTLQSINIFADSATKIKVSGTVIKPQTIEVSSVQIIRRTKTT